MQPEEPIDIVFSAERERCTELALVLESQAIPALVHWNGRSWALGVAADSVQAAKSQLEAYSAESRRAARPGPPLSAIGKAWPGIVAYAVVILGMALVAPEMRLGFDWLAAGGMDGARLAAGEWWRPITALTLHADAAHLLGNLAFGSFFGFSVARYLGGGFGWLAIVVSGALGNLANGLLSGPDHRSIGASTAVFAALGLLSAYCWRRGFPAGATRRERLAPVAAGIGLLAFTGAGGVDTDIGAHLFGFLAGFSSGLVIARLGFPAAHRAQLASGAAALGIVVVAWLAAVA